MNIASMSKQKRVVWFVGLVALAFLLLVPLLLPRFWVCLSTEILIMGLAGVALNLLLGYGGSLSFGQAAFFAAGAYTTAILFKKTMLSPFLILMVAPLIASAIGAVFGFIVARVYRFYYAMITCAFSMLLWTIIRKWSSLTGGDDGITGVDTPALLTGINNAYFFTLVVVAVCLLALWTIINSPFGWTLRAIKENPTRCRFTNINVTKHRYIAFVISSFFTGIAGSLFVVYSRSTFPDYCYWVKSGDIIIIVILGGMFSFLGPLVGAAVLISLQTLITSVTLYWPIFMGIIICAVVLLIPDGVMGIGKWVTSRAEKNHFQI